MVSRHVDDFWGGGLNLDDGIGDDGNLLFDHLLHDDIRQGYGLLGGGLKIASLTGLSSHVLDGGHDLTFLGHESLSQVDGPLKIMVHLRQNIGNLGNGLDILVPGLRGEVGEIICVFHEPGGENNIERIGGSRQDGGNQGVGVEGNGSY